jgi:hypothetical protein
MTKDVEISKVVASIKMIKLYVTGVDTTALIEALEAIKENPEDRSLLVKAADSLEPLGIGQGEVLSYAPYLTDLLADELIAGALD